jgi:hypothetical protein
MTGFMPGRQEFLDLGTLLEFPGVNALMPTMKRPYHLEPGKASWSAFAARAVPREREALLATVAPGWSSEMMVTTAARERIRAWVAAGGLARPDTPQERAELVGRVAVVGDDTLELLVRDALGRLPLVVLDHLRRHAVLLPVGRRCGGFAALLPAPEADAIEARRVLVLAYDGSDKAAEIEFLVLVAHETAHAWLLPSPSCEAVRPEAEARTSRQRYLRVAVSFGMLDRVIRPAERDEYQAAALAHAWGFEGANTEGAGCAANARRKIMNEVAGL